MAPLKKDDFIMLQLGFRGENRELIWDICLHSLSLHCLHRIQYVLMELSFHDCML